MSEKPTASRDAGYFNKLYEANPDPWNFIHSDYERGKYDATIAALQARRFTAGFEVGCSIGVLTTRLAEHCARLLAIDLAPAALAEAQLRCAALTHVQFESRRVPEDWPDETFDLIVFSEVLYFLTPADITRVAGQTCTSLTPTGVVLLVNYLEEIAEPCGGAEAACLFIAATAPWLAPIQRIDGDRFRIDVLQPVRRIEGK